MEIDPKTYPSRAFIRFIAQNQLQADLTGQSFTARIRRSGKTYVQQVTPVNLDEPIGEAPEELLLDKLFFEDLAETIFNPNCNPDLYQSCGTESAAKAVEKRVANDLVQTYLNLKRKKKCPIVERLNQLL